MKIFDTVPLSELLEIARGRLREHWLSSAILCEYPLTDACCRLFITKPTQKVKRFAANVHRARLPIFRSADIYTFLHSVLQIATYCNRAAFEIYILPLETAQFTSACPRICGEVD